MKYIEEFNKLWEDFMVKLNGQIMKRSAEKMPSCKQMNMILEDCVLDWVSQETVCGRWFLQFEAENAKEARLVREILLEDMHFQECESQRELPSAAKIVVPAVGAVAGLAVSRALHAGTVIQAASAIVPAVALSPVMMQVEAQLRSNNTQKLTEEYLQQMDVYYRSILSVLEG